MLSEERLDNLIEAGWKVLESGFDIAAFQEWRQLALACVRDLSGPELPAPSTFEIPGKLALRSRASY